MKRKRQEALCLIVWLLLILGAVACGIFLLGVAGASDLGRLDIAETLRHSVLSFCGAAVLGSGAYAMRRWVL